MTNGESICGDSKTEVDCTGSNDIYAEGGNAYVNGNMGGSVSVYPDRLRVGALGGFGGGGMGKSSPNMLAAIKHVVFSSSYTKHFHLKLRGC